MSGYNIKESMFLESLLGTNEASFRHRIWPQVAARYRTSAELFETLAALDVLTDPDAWLDRAPTLTRFPETRPMARSEARRRYHAGQSIYLVGLDRIDETLRGYCDDLASCLAVAPQYVSVEAWAAGGASSVHWHYDLDFNFNIQIVGEKEWQTSKCMTAENPLQSFHPGSDTSAGGGVSDRSPPPQVLENAETRHVEPGDVVYLPRGVWHATQTSAATLAMAFVIKPPTWAELVSHSILEKMHREGQWRERVLGAQNLSQQVALRNSAKSALLSAQTALESTGPAELMFRSFWSGDAQTLQVSADAQGLRFERTDSKTILSWHNQENSRQIEVPSWARAPVVKLIEHGAPQSVAKLHDTVSAIDVPFLNAFITRLIDAGLLERVSQ